MSPEVWLSLAAVGLLVVAAVARSLAWSGVLPGTLRWHWGIPALRIAAAGSLAAALALGLTTHAAQAPLTALQVAQAVSVAALLLDLALWVSLRLDGGGLGADLLAVALVAVGLGAGWPAGPALDCGQCAVPAQVQGVLFLSGAGSAMVMAGSGLALPLRAAIARLGSDRSLPDRAGLCGFMKGATALTLALLGAGLLVGTWWTWQVLGRLVGDGPRWGWMAAAWLFALISWLAWRLSQRSVPAAVGFALLAVVTASVGVLAAEPLQHWFAF